MNKDYIIGIDTSNYSTSVAIVNSEGEVIANEKQILEVKKGDKGLRQSEAHFQHVNILPKLIEEVLSNGDVRQRIGGVCVSTAPRNVEDSYMPVFTAGKNFGATIASMLGVPLVETYHQDGHFAAAILGTKLQEKGNLIGFHFSGGTTEGLLKKGDKLEIAAGTKDISFGQLIDRIGVKLGFQFPAGEYMDNILMTNSEEEVENKIEELKIAKPAKVKVIDNFFNLSGTETHLYKILDALEKKGLDQDTIIKIMSKLTFDLVAETICELIKSLNKKYKNTPFIFFGGVMESKYLRSKIEAYCKRKKVSLDFAAPGLSGDNAVGVAYLGGKKLWPESR